MAPSTPHVAGAPLHRHPSHWTEAVFPPVHRPLAFALPDVLIIHQGLRVFTADRQVIGTSCAFTATTLLLAPQSAVLPIHRHHLTTLIFEIAHCIILHLPLSWTLAFLPSPFPSFNLLYNKCCVPSPSPSPLSSSIDNQAHEDKKVCALVSDTP